MQTLEEEAYIKYTEDYYKLETMRSEESEKLEEIANDFLDNEGVTNEEIREAYIGYYVDKNENVYLLIDDYLNKMKYRMITDFYIVFLQAINDKERIKIIENKISSEELEKTFEKIKEYEEYIETEEFKEEMEQNLEEI